MKDYIYKYVLTLVAFFFASGVTAQTDVEFDEDDSSAVADTLMPDTFKVAEQALPWNIAVAKHLDNLLEHDMFETSTVGMMVYDLDADSITVATLKSRESDTNRASRRANGAPHIMRSRPRAERNDPWAHKSWIPSTTLLLPVALGPTKIVSPPMSPNARLR